jgi:hypothetical protein
VLIVAVTINLITGGAQELEDVFFIRYMLPLLHVMNMVILLDPTSRGPRWQDQTKKQTMVWLAQGNSVEAATHTLTMLYPLS